MAWDDFFGQIGSGVMNLFGVETTNQQNERLMREQWQREDTAMQRRVKDLEAAGLSKWLAAGTGGASASSPITLQTPDFNFIGDAITAGVTNDATRAQTKKAKEEAEIILQTASSVAEKAQAEAREATANALMAEHDADVLKGRPKQMRGDTGTIKNASALANLIGDVVDSSTAKGFVQSFKDRVNAMRDEAAEKQKAATAERERKKREKEEAARKVYWDKIHAAGDKAARDANVKWHWKRIFGNNY